MTKPNRHGSGKRRSRPAGGGPQRLVAADALLAVSQVLSSTLEFTEALRRTTREMTQALGADTGSVWRLIGSGDELVPIAGYHVPKGLEALSAPVPVVPRHPLVEQLRALDRPVWSSHSQGDPRFDYPLLRVLPHRSALVYPMRAKGQIIGIFVLIWLRAAHRFTGPELRLVNAIGQQAAVALENARLLTELGLVNVELERRVGERTAELRAANEALHTSRERLSAHARYLQRVRETEAARISREIHDELGQILTTLKLGVVRLAREVGHAHGRVAEHARALVGGIDETIQVVRRIASELRPRILDDLGLVAALEWQIQEFEARAGIRCRFRTPRPPPGIHPELSTAVFRIVQEALTNVARHAEATEVDVILKTTDGTLVIEVRDNGKGMPDPAVVDSRALGLVGMRERAADFGGEVVTRSSPGQGTTVVLTVPWPSCGPA